METVNEIFLKCRALLNQYTEDGSLLPEADVIDMQKKSILFCDMAQKEIYKYARLDTLKDNPTTLKTIDDVLEVNSLGNQAIVYYVSARLAPFNNKELVNFFEDKYNELKHELKKTSKATIEEINFGGDDYV